MIEKEGDGKCVHGNRYLCIHPESQAGRMWQVLWSWMILLMISHAPPRCHPGRPSRQNTRQRRPRAKGEYYFHVPSILEKFANFSTTKSQAENHDIRYHQEKAIMIGLCVGRGSQEPPYGQLHVTCNLSQGHHVTTRMYQNKIKLLQNMRGPYFYLLGQ